MSDARHGLPRPIGTELEPVAMGRPDRANALVQRMSGMGHNRRYKACCANDRFSIRKRTLCAAAPNDGTWPIPAVGAGRPLRLIGALGQAKPIPGRDSL